MYQYKKETDLGNGSKIEEYIYENGVTSSQAFYNADGQIEGVRESWNVNGRLSSATPYVNVKKEGEWVYYFQNGDLERKCTYKDDMLEGLYQSWQVNETLMTECMFVKDKKEGLCRRWDAKGNETREYYENGEQVPLPPEYRLQDFKNNYNPEQASKRPSWLARFLYK